jgi:hypothetical protein
MNGYRVGGATVLRRAAGTHDGQRPGPPGDGCGGLCGSSIAGGAPLPSARLVIRPLDPPLAESGEYQTAPKVAKAKQSGAHTSMHRLLYSARL